MTPEPDTTPERELRHERRDQPCPKCGQFYGTHYCDDEPSTQPAPSERLYIGEPTSTAMNTEPDTTPERPRIPNDTNPAGMPRECWTEPAPAPPEDEWARLVADGWVPVACPEDGGEQIVNGQWYAPKWGCDSLAYSLDACRALLAQKDAEREALRDALAKRILQLVEAETGREKARAELAQLKDRLANKGWSKDLDEIDRLRAELAQERERAERAENAHLVKIDELEAEVSRLRALCKEGARLAQSLAEVHRDQPERYCGSCDKAASDLAAFLRKEAPPDA